MNTIAEQWASFEAAVMPASAGPVQRQEMRRAFYAGFEGALRIAWNIGDESVSEDGGVAILEGLHEECRMFAAQVGRGEA